MISSITTFIRSEAIWLYRSNYRKQEMPYQPLCQITVNKNISEQSKGTHKLQTRLLNDLNIHFQNCYLYHYLFCLLLWMLYLRHKKFYYADHGIFAIHIYCAIFLLILFHYLLDALKHVSGWGIFSWFNTGLVLYGVYFVYKAMRNFYGQGRKKTLIKYIILSWMTSIIMVILILIFFIITAFNI